MRTQKDKVRYDRIYFGIDQVELVAPKGNSFLEKLVTKQTRCRQTVDSGRLRVSAAVLETIVLA